MFKSFKKHGGNLLKNISGIKNNYFPGHLSQRRLLKEVAGEWDNYLTVFSALGETAMLCKVEEIQNGEVAEYRVVNVSEDLFENLTGIKKEDAAGKEASVGFRLGKAPFLKEITYCLSEKQKIVFDTYFSTIEKYLNVTIYFLTKRIFVIILNDITEKKVREIELNISQKQLNSIVSQSPDIIYRLDKHGHFTFISDAIENYGLRRDELIGKPVFDLVHPEDKDKAHFRINERRTGKRSTKTLEIRLDALKDMDFPFEEFMDESQKIPYFSINAEGQYMGSVANSEYFVGTQGVMRDVTHRKLAMKFLKKSNDELNELIKRKTAELNTTLDELMLENIRRKQVEEELKNTHQELKENYQSRLEKQENKNQQLSAELHEIKKAENELTRRENLLKSAIEAGKICIWDLDVKTNKVTWHYNGEKIFKVKAADLAANYADFIKFVYKDDKAKLREQIRRVFKESSKIFSTEFRIKDSEGNILWMEAKARLVTENKSTAKYIGTLTDITEVFETNTLLKETENKYQTLFQKSPNAILLVDPDSFKPLEFNDKVLDLFDYPPDEFKKIKLKQVFSDYWEPHDFAFSSQTEKVRRFEAAITTGKGKQKDVFVSGKPIEYFNKKVLYSIIIDISRYKLYERELKKISNVILQTTDNVIITNNLGIIEYVNPAFENFTGYTLEEVVGKSTKFLNAGKLSDNYYENILSTIKSGYVFQGEICTKKKNGDIYFEEVTITPLRNENGEITHFVSTAKEITSSKKTAESLLKFSNIVKQMGNSVIITDKNGIIEYVNPAFEEITGYTLAEVEGKTPVILKSGKHDKTYYKEMWETLLKGDIYRNVVINKRKNGELYHEEKTISPLKDLDGNITHFIATGKDITRRIEIEKSLKDSENNYKALYDNNPSMVFKIDARGKILSVNKFGAEKLGFSVKGLENTLVYDLYHTHDKVPFKKFMDKCLATPNKVFNAEFRLTNNKNEEIWVNETIQTANVVDDQMTMFVVCNDISESKKNQVEKDELQSQLLQIQKMDAIGNLAGGIAHDFNNMLTVINGHAEVALLTLGKDQPSHRHMISILKAGKRAENLTRQLLAFSRKQIFDPKILNINTVILDLDKMMRRLIGEDITMDILLDKSIPMIKGESGQIEQILVNLIVNARDALNEKAMKSSEKKITIETSVSILDEAYVSKHVGSKTGTYVMIAVSDTGIGIPEEVQKKIFEPFFTTKNIGHGTGLGLATVYGIVKQNNAFIYVYSEPGKGATFKIYWPITSEKVKKNGHINPEAMDVRGKENILMVEDDESVRLFMVNALSELGYKIYQAGDGQEALKILDKKKLKPDMLVTDMVMPKMSGLELEAKIKKRIPDIRVLYTSGYTDTYIVEQGQLKEGINFIQKPFSILSLARKIREILDKKSTGE